MQKSVLEHPTKEQRQESKTAAAMKARPRKNPATTEVDAYIFIKENLKTLAWDTRNPERVPAGQVWTQNECLSNAEIKKWLGLERPENIVKITEKVLWVIEAKRSHSELATAVREARDYAKKLDQSRHFKALQTYSTLLVETFTRLPISTMGSIRQYLGSARTMDLLGFMRSLMEP
jgi:hypothetical protein